MVLYRLHSHLVVRIRRGEEVLVIEGQLSGLSGEDLYQCFDNFGVDEFSPAGI